METGLEMNTQRYISLLPSKQITISKLEGVETKTLLKLLPTDQLLREVTDTE